MEEKPSPTEQFSKANPLAEAMKAIGDVAQAARNEGKASGGDGTVGDFFHKVKPSEAQRDAAQRRLHALSELLQAKPKPILEQFNEIGLPYVHKKNVDEQPEYDTIVILLKDIEEADRELLSRGTLYEQMYGEEVEE